MDQDNATTSQTVISSIKIEKRYSFSVNGEEYYLIFYPLDHTGGELTHRVIIFHSIDNLHVKKDWLKSTHKPSAKTAAFYVQKHFNPNFR